MANPNWKPGISGNPNGRPRNAEADELRKALKEVEKVKKKTFLRHCVERAFSDDGMAREILKKFVPDKKEVIMDVGFDEPLIEIVRKLRDEKSYEQKESK